MKGCAVNEGERVMDQGALEAIVPHVNAMDGLERGQLVQVTEDGSERTLLARVIGQHPTRPSLVLVRILCSPVLRDPRLNLMIGYRRDQVSAAVGQ